MFGDKKSFRNSGREKKHKCWQLWFKHFCSVADYTSRINVGTFLKEIVKLKLFTGK